MRLCTYLSGVLVRSIILIEITCLVAYCAKPPIVSKKSKLCGDEQCEEVLFKAKVKRVMGSNHEAFLSLTEGAIIDVTAVKFSDRTDLMEGKLSDGRRGNFYVGAIDIGPYVEFLRNAIATRKEMKEISQDRIDVGSKKLLGSVRADLYLVRDYNVQARTYAKEQNVPEPELLPVPEILADSHHGHTHAHGHSHGAFIHDHGHSHGASGDDHGHSHGTSNTDHGHSHGTSSSDHGHSHDSSSQDHGHSHDGHFHEDTLISHVHNANVKVDADQESKGGHINNDLKQGSLEDKARQIPLGNVPIKTAGQAETLLVQEATPQETSPQKETINVATHQEKPLVLPDVPSTTPAPAIANAEIRKPDVTVTTPLGENVIREDGAVPATTQTVPTVPLDIIASHVVKEEKTSQHVDLPPPVQSSTISPPPQPVVAESVPLSANPTSDGAKPATRLPPAASEVTPSHVVDVPSVHPDTPSVHSDAPTPAKELDASLGTTSNATMPDTAAASGAPPLVSTTEELKAVTSGPPTVTSTDEAAPHAHEESPPVVSLAKEPEIAVDAMPAAGVSKEQTAGVSTEQSTGVSTEQIAGVSTEQAAGVSKEAPADVSSTSSSSSLDTEYCAREECPSGNGLPSAESFAQGTSDSQGEVKAAEQHVPPSEAVGAAQQILAEQSSVCDGPVGGFLKSFFGSIKTIIPISGLDGAAIGLVLNFAFLMVFIVIHFTSYFLSDFNESKLFDRMITHDLATNCKLLEEQTRMKEVELNRVRTAASQFEGDENGKSELQVEIRRKNMEIQELFRNGESLKAQVDQLERLLQSTKAELESERSDKVEANRCAEECKQRVEESERAYSNISSELASVQKMRKLLEESLSDERRAHAEATAKLKEAKEDLKKLRSELDTTNAEKEKLKLEKNNLELENTTLSAMIEEMDKNRKEGSAGESGGSGGWSDFGDDFGETEEDKEKTPASSTVTIPTVVGSDVREAAKLRAQLKKSEQEVETVRAALDHEKEHRQELESKVEALKSEVEKKSKEVEDHDRERSRADERCNELLSIMKENTLVIREAELLRDKLQENLSRQQAELASLIQEKRTKEDRIQELEVELKRVRNEHLKLETKRFNEVLDLKHRLDAMQTNHQLSNSATGYDLLNQSVSSSDRETILPPALLWEEAPRAVSRNCATSPEDEFLLETLPIPKRGSMRGRRSDRGVCDQSSFEMEKRREKKESSHRRVRSRSHGRQLWGGAVLDQPQLYPERSGSSHDLLNRRHSRSSHIHYSSGGSNEGRSPPPEIPLLSAVPPPGVKKPMGKRVIDADFDIKSS